MTKHRNENTGSRQSVFERLDGKASTKSVVYCSSWLKTGSCPNGKNCKYVGSHINLSASDSRDISKSNAFGLHSKYKMKPHLSSKSGKEKSSPDQNWDNWDQNDLEYADEKMLEKRLELLRRELLNAEVKGDSSAAVPRSKHHSRSKHKVITEKKKRKHSSSSSSSSSSGSSSSQSSSSSSSSEEAPSTARYKQNRRSASSSPPSPKHKPRSFQKHNKEKRMSPEKKIVRNSKGFGTKGNHKKSPTVKSARHRTPLTKRKASPVKQSRAPSAMKKDKGRGAYSPPPHKRDRKSHSPRRPLDKKPHSPKRPPRTPPPHRLDNKHARKSPPVRDNRNQRGGGNNVQRKSPPLRRNIDRNIDNRTNKQQKIVKGRFDKNNKDDNRRNVVHDKREDERLREKCRLLREAEIMEKERRKSPGQDSKGRDVKKRGDKERELNTKRDMARRHKEPERFSKAARADPSLKTPTRGDERRGGRTPAQGRLMERMLERKGFLGERGGDKEKRVEKERIRDRGLDRVQSEHTSRASSREYEPVTSGLRGREDTRFPSPGDRSPCVRYPEDRHNYEARARSQEGDGEWDKKYGEPPNKWDRLNKRNNWEKKKEWGPGQWNDGMEWSAGGRTARPAPPSSGPGEARRPMRRARTGEDLEEVLSDISDDADEILNRDEETFHSDVDSTVSEDETDLKISTLICGPMQDPLTQRLLADDYEGEFEEEEEEEVDAKTSISDALGVDWASLVQDTKPLSSQEQTGSAKKRWEPAQMLSRLGISEAFAGKEKVEQLKKKYSLEKAATTSIETGECAELDAAPVILHAMPGVHSALRERLRARRQLFDPARRALTARHDLTIRKQVCGFPATFLQQIPVAPAIAS